jgi:hypothetical protein
MNEKSDMSSCLDFNKTSNGAKLKTANGVKTAGGESVSNKCNIV